jgi:hypothetical protein
VPAPSTVIHTKEALHSLCLGPGFPQPPQSLGQVLQVSVPLHVPSPQLTLALAGLQSVCTLQFAQEKFTVPVLSPVAVPVKYPEEFTTTPEKFIQPKF